MTDAELEDLCQSDFTGQRLWQNWTSELYSFGRCFRFLTKYPSFFPLYFQSDHGVALESELYPFELNSKEKIHFTWHQKKEQNYNNHSTKSVIRITHPWIVYRRLMGIERSNDPKGTIIFFTHHAPGINWVGHDSEEYFSQLRQLPEKFQPVVLCLHMHDINAGHHKEIRRQGFPIVTVGNTSSTLFVDRFYSLIKNFSYATSQNWGSQVAYCVEFGVPYFFLGKQPKLINFSHSDMPVGEVYHQNDFHKEIEKQADELFRSPVDVVSTSQLNFIESLLGIDSKISYKQVTYIIWFEFFRNWMQWPLIIKFVVISILRKIGCIGLVKKIILFVRGVKF